MATLISAIPPNQTITNSPLGKLAPLQPMAEAVVEGAPIAAFATQTLMNVSGSGTVRSVWMAHSNASFDVSAYWDLRLRVYVDGESVPSIDVDAATMFLSAYEAAELGFFSGTEHVHSETAPWPNQKQTMFLRYPIPYSSACKIEVVNPTPSAGSIFSQVLYQPGVTSAFRLKSIALPLVNAATATASAEPVLFTTPSGSSGWLVWMSYAGRALGPQPTFLERNFEFQVDGEATPAIVATGTEDLFLSGWYFAGLRSTPNMNTNYMTVSLSNTAAASPVADAVMAVDLLAQAGGLPFTSQMVCTLRTEGRVLSGHEYAYTALFYTPSTSAWGTASTATVAPTAPTSVIGQPAGSGAINVRWSPPVNAGSTPVASYTVTPSAGTPVTVGVNATAATLTGLTGTVTAAVTANSSAGTSTASASTASVTVPTLTNNPASVTGMGGWWRADALAYNEQAHVNGSAVWTLPDLSGGRAHIRQPQSARMPLLTTGIVNSLPVLRFSTTTTPDFMSTGALSLTGACTVFAVVKTPASITANQKMLGGPTSPLWVLGTNASSQLVLNAGGSDVGLVTVSASTAYVISAMSGASGNVWLNGTAGTAGSAGTSNLSRLFLNADDSVTSFSTYDFAEVLVYSGQLSSANRLIVERYLGTKYAITVL